MNICVFCSSSEELNAEFYTLARQLGEWIGVNAHTLVYGGSEKGLMRECAKAVKLKGGKIISVSPPFVVKGGLLNPQTDELYEVPDLPARKRKMIELGDAFVVLPGGIGTLDELFDVAAANVVGDCCKPIFLINVNKIFDKLVSLLDELESEHLIRRTNSHNLHVVGSLEEFCKVYKSSSADSNT